MDYKKFKSILIKSISALAILSIVILLMGIGVFAYMLTDSKSSVIGLSIFGGIFLIIGLLLLYKTIPAIISLKLDKHPVLKGIKENRRDAIVWLYQKQIDTTLGNDGPKVGSSNNISLWLKNGDGIELILSQKTSPEEIIDFIRSNFDIPYIGYSDDNREAVTKLFGRNAKWQKM